MKFDAVKHLHSVVRLYFKARGFHWEERRTGELRMGYWKIKLNKGKAKHTYPRRLVIIPGFGDSPLSWHPVTALLRPALGAHYDEMVLMDFPGFRGFLSGERSFPTMDQLIGATQDALDALKPTTILGHSLGGWLAAHYAMDCGTGKRPQARSLNYRGPEMVVLANPSGVFPDAETKLKWATLFQRASKEGFSIMRPHIFAKEPIWFDWVSREMAPFINREDIAAFIESVRDDHSIEEKAREIQCKVWLVWGEKDSMIPVTCAGAWLRKLKGEATDKVPQPKPDAQAVILHQSGHSPHLEQPVILATVLGQILSGRTPSSKGRRWWKVLDPLPT